ncbi:MAG TPA: preprotein translocase subunit SecE [Aggregatilineales bacterium]|nr:preprotein translocase subunit SecE [Aggregatilineales bacterium]
MAQEARKRGSVAEEEELEEVEELEEELDDDESDGKGGYTERKGRATPGKRSRQEATEERGNFVVRFFRGLREYLRGVKEELEKVVWPTREELSRLARIILVVTLFAALVLGVMSFVFTELFVQGFNNNIVFLLFFVGVGVIYFVVGRILKSSDTSPY